MATTTLTMRLALLLQLCMQASVRAWAPGMTPHLSSRHIAPLDRAAAAARTCASTIVMQRGRGRGRYAPPPPPKDMTPINEAIQFDSMRVMADDGGGGDEMLGIMSKEEALAAAAERDLDLVLIAGKSDPPVVKIVSYDKFRFAKEKKRKEQQKAAARGKSELKELKLSYKIGDHDFGVRKKNAIKFLSSGDKVKFSMLFRGREVTHSEVGRKIMMRMAEEIDDVGVLDAPPRVMGRQMIMMVSPRPRTK